MADSDCHQRLKFNFEGQFLNFVRDDGKLKYIRLRILSEDVQIKLPKAMQIGGLSLQPGEFIQVTGVGKFDRSGHALKLKASQVIPLIDYQNQIMPEIPPHPVSPVACPPQNQRQNPKIKVLVCQKSECVKRGGKGLCEALGQTLCERGLSQSVSIERTGCLKRCSSAPNLVILPGNHRYTDVRPKTLPKIANTIAQSLTRL